jgi:endonuclease YncB( thermonuclease family)
MAARQGLANLILGKQVVLDRPVNIDHGRVVCDVYYNG